MTEWWTTQTGTLIGALGGGGLGAIAGIYGALAGTLAPRGRAKGLVLGMHVTLLLIGLAGLGAGVVAVSTSQPYHVYYPLLLMGSILSVITGALLPVIRFRYRQAEHRRLEAEELRRG